MHERGFMTARPRELKETRHWKAAAQKDALRIFHSPRDSTSALPGDVSLSESGQKTWLVTYTLPSTIDGVGLH